MKSQPLPLTKSDAAVVLNKFWEKVWKEVLSPSFDMLSDKIDNHHIEIKAEIKENRRLIHDLQIDTPTRIEFDRLKKRVDSFKNTTSN